VTQALDPACISSAIAAALAGGPRSPCRAEAKVAFGGLSRTVRLPVEVQADTLSVNQGRRHRVFSGNVLVGQGEMRLRPATVEVEYGEDGEIARLHADRRRHLRQPSRCGRGAEAVYTIDTGVLVLTGDVLLTQGASALIGQKLTINLKDGTGVMEGRVSTVFVPGAATDDRSAPRSDGDRRLCAACRSATCAKATRSRPVIRDVSMDLNRGEVVALLGPNGSGKTTCFYSIAGLVTPEGGQVLIDGRDVTALPMYRRARLGIGYLPQEVSIFRGLSVEDNILAVLEIAEPTATSGASGWRNCSANFPSPICAAPRRWRCRAANGAGWKSPAAWRPTRNTCCWTNPSPASTRSRWAKSAIWCMT
jgi:lipopolysaccharide transport protein LptA